MKKFIGAVLLSVCFMLLFSINTFANQDDKYEGLLSAIGIIDSSENTADKNSVAVTRAEFTAMVVKAFKYDYNAGEGETPVFTDVVLNHWAHNYIVDAYRAGIINGNDDGTFCPDEPITLNDAVSICVNALGYNVIENAYSGSVLSKRVELAKNIKKETNHQITLNEAYILVFNALHSDYMYMNTVNAGSSKSSYLYGSSQKNALLAIHDIDVMEDTVTADPYISLYGEDVQFGEVMVGNVRLKANFKIIDGLVGYNVKCYYRNSNEIKDLIYIYKHNNREIVSKLENVKYSNGSFTITNDKGNKSLYQVKNNTTVLLNNHVLTSDAILKDSHTNIFSKAGEIRLIGSSSSGAYQTIIINYYDNMKVRSFDRLNKIIVGTDGREIHYDKYENVRFLNEKRVDIDSSDVKTGYIISVVDPGNYNDTLIVYVSTKQAELTVEALKNTDRIVVCEDEQYIISDSTVENKAITELKTGYLYEVLFDVFGEIAYWEVKDAKYSAGYVIKLSDPGSFGDVKVKLLSEEGEIVIYDLKESVKLRNSDGTINPKASSMAVYNLFSDGSGGTNRQIIMYRVKNNVIFDIMLPVDGTHQDTEFHEIVNYAGSGEGSLMIYRSSQKSIFGQYVFKDTSRIFLVPKQNATGIEDSDFMVKTSAMFSDASAYDLISSTSRYSGRGYCVKEDGFLTDYMVIEADFNKTSTSESLAPVLVTQINKTVPGDLYDAYELVCVNSSGAVVNYTYYDIDGGGVKDISNRIINPGDIIRTKADERGYRTRLNLQTMWDYKNSDLVTSIGITYNFRYDATVRVTTAKVLQKDGEYVQLAVKKHYPNKGTFVDGTEIYNIKNAIVMSMTMRNNSVELLTHEKVSVGDEFMLFTSLGTPKCIIYYE